MIIRNKIAIGDNRFVNAPVASRDFGRELPLFHFSVPFSLLFLVSFLLFFLHPQSRNGKKNHTKLSENSSVLLSINSMHSDPFVFLCCCCG